MVVVVGGGGFFTLTVAPTVGPRVMVVVVGGGGFFTLTVAPTVGPRVMVVVIGGGGFLTLTVCPFIRLPGTRKSTIAVAERRGSARLVTDTVTTRGGITVGAV